MTRSHRLQSPADVDDILERSHTRPVMVFKHSATCGISAMAWEQWQAFLETPEAAGVYCTHLIVQEDRPVSNDIAQRLDVRHESPQAILIVDGKAYWHTSHMAITRDRLIKAAASTPAPSGTPGGSTTAGDSP